MELLSFFKSIKTGEILNSDWSKELDIITNGDLENLKAVLVTFQSYIKTEKSIRRSILSVQDVLRIEIDAEKYGIPDPDFDLCYKFEKFLKEIIVRNNVDGGLVSAIVNGQKFDSDIFKDEKAYNFFIALKDDIVKDRTKYADYSFIYKKMLEDNLLRKIGHNDFILFLEKNEYANFDGKYNQLKVSETEKKKSCLFSYKTSI